jgi:hypothetical protein
MYIWWPGFSIPVSPWYFGLRANRMFIEIFTDRSSFVPDSTHLVFTYTKNNLFSNEAEGRQTRVLYNCTDRYGARKRHLPTIFDRRRRVTRNP